jgi:hypothetical protein
MKKLLLACTLLSILSSAANAEDGGRYAIEILDKENSAILLDTATGDTWLLRKYKIREQWDFVWVKIRTTKEDAPGETRQ